jgi:hypothetical protein
MVKVVLRQAADVRLGVCCGERRVEEGTLAMQPIPKMASLSPSGSSPSYFQKSSTEACAKKGVGKGCRSGDRTTLPKQIAVLGWHI